MGMPSDWSSAPGPDARQLQQVRRADRAAGDDHFLARAQAQPPVRSLHFDADGALSFEQDALHQRLRHHREVGAAAGAPQVGLPGAAAKATQAVLVEQRRAFALGAIQAVAQRQARFAARVQEGLAQRMALQEARHRQRMIRRGAVHVLDLPVVRQHFVERPAGAALGHPVRVLGVAAAHVQHAVERTGATQHPALRHGDRATRRVLGLVAPAEGRVVDQLQEACRHVDEGVAVFGTGFDQQHLMAPVFSEPVGQHRARAAGAQHQVVRFAVPA